MFSHTVFVHVVRLRIMPDNTAPASASLVAVHLASRPIILMSLPGFGRLRLHSRFARRGSPLPPGHALLSQVRRPWLHLTTALPAACPNRPVQPYQLSTATVISAVTAVCHGQARPRAVTQSLTFTFFFSSGSFSSPVYRSATPSNRVPSA